MNIKRVLLIIFFALAVFSMIIAMFQPFEILTNKIYLTISIGILSVLGYMFYMKFFDKKETIGQINTLDEQNTNNFNPETLIENSLTQIKIKIDNLKKVAQNDKNINLKEKQLHFLCNEFNFGIGIMYEKHKNNDRVYLLKSVSYAHVFEDEENIEIEWGDDIIGQAAKNGEVLYFDHVPEEYFKINSGLGESLPKTLIIAPFKKNNETIGVIELAGFESFNESKIELFKNTIHYLF